MKKSLSISALIVIFIAQLAGLMEILYLSYCMDMQVALHNTMVEEIFEAETDVELIRSLLYKYEYNMASVMSSSESRKARTLQTLSATEIQIRKQLMIHGKLMRAMDYDSENERLFRSVNDDVLKYLNYNVVLLSMKPRQVVKLFMISSVASKKKVTLILPQI